MRNDEKQQPTTTHNTMKDTWEYCQHDVNWPKVAGESVDLPQQWHALELGQNGWELVSTVRTPSGTVSSLFKRRVADCKAAMVPAGETVKTGTAEAAPSVKKGGRKA